jgi:GntR family transcriptional regulator
MSEQRDQDRVPPQLPGAIERDSPVPFYFQLATLFEHEIFSGRWPAGVRLPSEPDICRHYQLSRTTVRQALSRLEQQGAVKRVRGQGTYIEHARPRSWMLHSPLGLFQGEMHRHGLVTSSVLRADVSPLPSWATDALGLPPGSSGVTLERVRSVDGLLVIYVVNHLPADFADTVLSFETPDDSLYQRLREQMGVEVISGVRNIQAVDAEERMAALLDVPPGFPLALIESVSWDESLRPFDCYRAWVRTDRMKIEIQISATVGAHPAADRGSYLAGRDI